MTVRDEASKLAKASGNAFHSRAVRALQEAGWTVLVSPYYHDHATQKPREIDLIAERAFPVSDGWGKRNGTLNIQLYIECKYIAQTTLFWFHDQDLYATEEILANTTPLRRDNVFTARHHYLKNADNQVAKLFGGKSGGDTESEQFYKALNQSLNAMIGFTNRGSVFPPNSPGADSIVQTVTYPVILCNDFEKMFRIPMDAVDVDPEPIDRTFNLEVNYAYSGPAGPSVNAFFLIDIVNFEDLSGFLSIVEADVEPMQLMLSD